MTDEDWRRSIEARILRIEAFLDAELRERQHFAQLNSAGSYGPVNSWYGCASGVVVQPVGVGPIIVECALGGTQPGVSGVAVGIGVAETDPIEDMLPEAGSYRTK